MSIVPCTFYFLTFRRKRAITTANGALMHIQEGDKPVLFFSTPEAHINNWRGLQVYWVGPLAGGVVAGLLYRFVLRIGKDDNASYDL